MTDSSQSPLLFERYELKYHIPESLVPAIVDFVRNYCEQDPFSLREPDGYYQINNIYLDTPNLLFMNRRLAGIDHRFNLRIRSYGKEPKFPYFTEIKYKTNGIIKKHRHKIYEEDWLKYFIRGEDDERNNLRPISINDYGGQFRRLASVYHATPQIYTQYRRLAFASFVDDYARVTFDRDLRFEMRHSFDVTPNEKIQSNYDHHGNYLDDTDIILELKCTTNVPLWFQDLIRQFGLVRTSFSKYVNGMKEILPELKEFSHLRPGEDQVSNFIH